MNILQSSWKVIVIIAKDVEQLLLCSLFYYSFERIASLLFGNSIWPSGTSLKTSTFVKQYWGLIAAFDISNLLVLWSGTHELWKLIQIMILIFMVIVNKDKSLLFWKPMTLLHAVTTEHEQEFQPELLIEQNYEFLAVLSI